MGYDISKLSQETLEESVAVIGMAGHLPGADSMDTLWQNLRQGHEAIRRFSVEEMLEAGVSADTLEDPDYVRAAAVVDEADCFDAAFFGFSPREARLLDPQHRIFLQTAWHGLEDAGYDPAAFDGAIGVYAGCFMNKYMLHNLYTNRAFLESPDALFARVSNDKDFLATRVSYLLDLRGPSLTIQTACSTSLVATHLACQGLLSFDCDMAMVGGAALNMPLMSGYQAVDGGFLTRDGQCRPFDANANGCLPGYGSAVVVLRRLADAVEANDHIRAIIRGTAINNDGSSKVGYTAPSVDSQAAVIAAAQGIADIHPETVGYLEAHGTGTGVGDPIEVAGLTQAFRAHTDATGFCALGSIKANIGHLDAAAGVASLIRAVLALQHEEIPPCANFQSPNPKLELETTPFYVPAEAQPWQRGDVPRRAGVSSLGVGGTNAHAVLEEAPLRARTESSRAWQLLTFSGRTPAAVEASLDRFQDYLERHQDNPDLHVADVAYTLQTGRRAFDHRRVVVCRDLADGAAALADPQGRVVSGDLTPQRRHVVFMFGGGGTQYPDMGLDLYRHEPVFRQAIDQCAELLLPRLSFDLRHYLYPGEHGQEAADRIPQRPPNMLCALVATSYAMARLWMSWGVQPQAMIGHSMGEYVAACLAEVFTLEQTLALAIKRGELFESVAPGAMMVVQLSADELEPRLEGRLSLAAVNAPSVCLVSGPREAIAELAAELEQEEVEHQKVHIPVASHSFMMEPVLGELTDFVRELGPKEPQIPFVSGVTGTWITPEDAIDPNYWARHIRQTVRFADGLGELLEDPRRVLLEVGPGNALCNLAAMQEPAAPLAAPSMRHPQDPQSDTAFLLHTVGKLWLAGVTVDWQAFHGDPLPRRVALPTYAFERRRYWIPPGSVGALSTEDNQDSYAGNVEGELIGGPPPSEGDVDAPVRVVDEPRNDMERQLVDIWQGLLGVTPIGIHDDFFALGGHSLMATHMMRTLRRRFGIQLELRALFEAPTVATLTAWIDGAAQGAPRPELDLAADVVLDDAVRPAEGASLEQGAPSTLLLTGATGFLGAFLCRELLRQTSANVLCLARAESTEDAGQRIEKNLRRYGCWDAEVAARLLPLPGDLSQPRLGLSDDAWDELGEAVDGIYHAAAWVNFARPYRSLKQTNVGGTEEILRLAVHRRLKPLHHVSTLAVLAGAIVRGDTVVPEDGPLPPAEGHDTGYSQSKWVAEGVIDLARQRGVPAAIYRPGMVLGDSQNGASNEDDYLTKMIEGCVRFGLAPLRDYPLAVATADYVAAALVHLSLSPDSLGKNYHLIDPEPLPWNRMFEQIRANGYDVESVPYERWRRELQERVQEDDGALESLLGLLSSEGDRAMPDFEVHNVLRGLEGSNVVRPQLDNEQMGVFLQFFVQRGWIPDAPAVTTTVPAIASGAPVLAASS